MDKFTNKRKSDIGENCVISKDVEAYSLIIGNPAKHYSYINKQGNKIEGLVK